MSNMLDSFRASCSWSLLLVLFMLPLSGCGDTTMKWKEQVDLHNHETIIVARTATMKSNWIAGGGGGSINKRMTLEVVRPARQDNPGVWSDHYVPILLDRDPDNGEWFLVATFYHCTEWYELGRPALPYTEYRFRGGSWVRQPLSAKWIDREVNVLPADLSNRELLNEKPVLSTEQKRLVQSRPTISDRFVRIVGTWKTHC
ncbi:hypothetical protein [Cupriavidus sp. BIC8F]|uniref:hypothetical protein n=1 Tax=Cupriavidus sp. BIC8F TaxID=3079014 RepID=UPI002916C5B6|nr:hypothetical protein [Cupriavidus sp. BIC8F]